MQFLPNVSRRCNRRELMDEPQLPKNRLIEALRGLERINWWSGSAGILWPPIRTLARESSYRPLRLLDVASGAGDLPIRLWRKARRADINLRVAGCDLNPQAVDFARRQAAQKSSDVHFFACDATAGNFGADYDVVVSSLFLHHLEDDQAICLLQAMARAARRLVLVNDLVRSRAGYLLAYSGTRFLSASDVVHSDGPLSVERAFTIEEVTRLAQEAGLAGCKIERRWPCRFLLSWHRPERLSEKGSDPLTDAQKS